MKKMIKDKIITFRISNELYEMVGSLGKDIYPETKHPANRLASQYIQMLIYPMIINSGTNKIFDVKNEYLEALTNEVKFLKQNLENQRMLDVKFIDNGIENLKKHKEYIINKIKVINQSINEFESKAKNRIE